MVRGDLEKKLKRIFGLEVSSAEPGSYEQDTLFVEVESCREHPSKGFTAGKILGNIVLFVQADKAPLGFFAKRINNTPAGDKKGFFFFEVDTEILNSQARIQNISERRCKFQYLYEEQYDPARKSMSDEGFQFQTEQIQYIDTGDGRVQATGDGPVIGAPT